MNQPQPSSSAALYLLALLPPEPVFGQVWALKQEVHQRTGSRNAVRLPPHITLIPPLRQPASFADQAEQALAEFTRHHRPFEVGLRDFRWFGNRTLFVHVEPAEKLKAVHAALTEWCATHLPQVPRENRPFTPHMTLATRDLPPAAVPELKADFASRHYEAHFEVRSLVLFRHDGQQWQNIREFALANG